MPNRPTLTTPDKLPIVRSDDGYLCDLRWKVYVINQESVEEVIGSKE